MSGFLKKRRLVGCKNRTAKREMERNGEEKVVMKNAINAAMVKVKEEYPNINVGDIIRFSAEGRKNSKVNNQHTKEILNMFVDEANYYCVKNKKKPLF
jgi:DNA-binding LytR/AlgR family response regulator